MGIRLTSFFGAGAMLAHFLLTPALLPAGTFREATVVLSGQDRTFRIFVPAQLERSTAIVFVFHGTQESGHGAESIIDLTHFDRTAEANHFIAIFPEAYDGNWNDGRENEMAQSYLRGIDDIGFVDKILEYTKNEYPVDRHRIFATGFSNGAIFCQYLAANRSAIFAAIAPVSGQLAFPFSKKFHPKDSISVLEIHGTPTRWFLTTVAKSKETAGKSLESKRPSNIGRGLTAVRVGISNCRCLIPIRMMTAIRKSSYGRTESMTLR